jgi:hypothetical protein
VAAFHGATIGSLEAFALPDDQRTPVEVRGIGRVLVADPLAPGTARALLVDQGDSEVSDVEFRDHWLSAVTGLDHSSLAGFSEPARHRLGLAILRVRGLEPQWRRLYGSPHPLVGRLRIVVGDDLRCQAPRVRRPQAGALIDLSQFRQTTEAVTRGLRPAMERFSEAALTPVRALVERIKEMLRPTLDAIRGVTDRFVRTPVFKNSLRVVDAYQRRIGEAARPMEALFRSRDETIRRFLDRTTAPWPEQAAGAAVPGAALELPDAATLATYYGQERADPTWRNSEIGWLLTAVPLSIGAVVHERFGISPVAGLAWLAERFARREMRRRLQRVLDDLRCSASLRQRLRDGADLFFDEHYHSADTLLTAGLDGLLFEVAEQQGRLGAGHRLITDGKAHGGRIKTASDSRLLNALGFSPSQQNYLAQYSIGQSGNPPRHGADAAVGSREHAAGALLGIVGVLAHSAHDQRAIVGLLR